MQPFLHDRVQRLGELLASSGVGLRAYATSEPTLPTLVAGFLTSAAQTYGALSLHVAENEMLALHAELVAARRRVTPASPEQVPSRRRELERSVALRVLLQSADRLRTDMGRDQERLRVARDQLAPVVVYALQNRLIELAEVPDDGESAAQKWSVLCAHAETQPATQQVLATTSSHDCVLLVLDLLTAIAHSRPQA